MTFDQELSSRLDLLKQQDLWRELRCIDSPQGTGIVVEGKPLLNFSSNDYLGLANDPRIKAAAAEGARRYGAGAGASRLICGSLAPQHELEKELTRFKASEATLTFSSGYAAALGTICALVGKDDIVIIDKLSHACIVDGVRLSGATLRVFAHNDMADLQSILEWATARRHRRSPQAPRPGILIISESVFSMDGDFAPLADLVALKERYAAWLMIDEAHATGLYGPHHRGLAEHFNVSPKVEVQMGTLGKALGSSGGYVCGSKTLIDFLVNRARSFIFSTAPVPAASVAATAAVRLIQSGEGQSRTTHLAELAAQLTAALYGDVQMEQLLHASSFPNQALPASRTIFPLLIGDEGAAVSTSSALRAQGIFVPAIRYPTVARGTARLRISLSAAHTHAEVDLLLAALAKLKLPFLKLAVS